ncbi:gamma carbonic anhydrase family protein [Ancylomarina longa]|uniref:Gamma carbonic anhydrase family protein n=1 Tax=Ancylomarina longa TaxID=2487017 RepID=A0A434AFR0_9BACT|nr:gamma carbonic anhydrase family protein [Ancylomarina longa]RUT73216.1 gamma carbonic anhydrase family protein [Ancylomarina longa]
MAYIRDLNGKSPIYGNNCFFADNAAIIGDVEMGNDCSIWFGAVLRGDVHYIKLGNNVNIQDNATIHATYKKSPTNIGNNVSIAHNAVVHGCTIKDNVLIGMGAVVLDDAVIESNSIVAAGSVITKGTHVESGSVYAGAPAKKIKEISPELLEGEINRIANSYAMYASWYQEDEKISK